MSTSRYPTTVDVAIVGSGPTGAAYARILTEQAPDLTIAIFEVGPTVSDPPGSHVKNISDVDQRAEAQRRSEGPGAGDAAFDTPRAVAAGRRTARPGTFLLPEGDYAVSGDGLPLAAMSSNVGGMAAHWTAACPRPGAGERIAFLDVTGELDELLAEGERLLGVTIDAFDSTPMGDVLRQRLGAAVDDGRVASARVQRMPLAVHRRNDGRLVWSGADVVFGEATRRNPRFQLFDESHVARVLVADGRATGVMVHDVRQGGEYEVHARFVVVAGDALRTPQLLWASGIRPDALGRYLNDQSQVVFAARITGLDVTAAANGASGGISEYSGVSWIPFTDELPFHGQIMQLDTSPVPLAVDDPVAPGSIVGIGLFSAKALRREDRLEFADDVSDDYGMPAIRVHYALTEADRDALERAEREAVRLAHAIGEPLDERPFRLPLGASLHYQGTTRMGESDDGESVCGPTCEVWGVLGLYVAGNGVIPTATACNPTLTGVALAVRGARDIASKARSVLT